MSKPKTQPVSVSFENNNNESSQNSNEINEPLSGSKKVKNRQHSRLNNGEG